MTKPLTYDFNPIASCLVDEDGNRINSGNPIHVTGTTGGAAVATAAAPSYAEGSSDDLSLDLSGHLRVTGTFWQTTQPISIADAQDVTLGAKADARDTHTDTTAISAMSVFKEISYCVQTGIPVSWAVAQHIIVDSGAISATANLAQVNAVTILTGAGATGTGSQRVTAAQDTTTIAGSAPGTAGTASANVVTVQGVASMTPVLVSGAAASGATAAGNPLLSGARASNTNPTAVTDGQAVAVRADLYGNLLALLNAPRSLKGTATASATDNSSHTLIGAGAANVFNDIEALWITNTSSTAVYVTISDGTVSYIFAAPALITSGISLPTMLAATSAMTAWTFQASTGETTIYIHATFAKRLVS